jgi:hypothetical protein
MMQTDFKILIPGTRQPITLSGEDIKVILLRRKLSVSAFAAAIDEPRSLTSMVLHGHRMNKRVRDKIMKQVASILAETPRAERKLIFSAA